MRASRLLPTVRPNRFAAQRGVVIVVVLLVLTAVSAAAIVGQFATSAPKFRLKQERATQASLAEAKSILLSWIASHPDVPGRLPFPDTDGDGYSNCFAAGNIAGTSSLLGLFPVHGESTSMSAPCSDAPLDFPPLEDSAAAEPLWYAVSFNLVSRYSGTTAGANEFPINPDMVTSDAFESRRKPWITLRDQKGLEMTSLGAIAAVIIAPGPPLENQVRDSANRTNPVQYLDEVTVEGNTYSNHDADGCRDTVETCTDSFDEDFIIYPENLTIQGSVADQANRFNDRIIVITVDEVIAAVQGRILAKAQQALMDYHPPVAPDFVRYFPLPLAAGAASTPVVDSTINSGNGGNVDQAITDTLVDFQVEGVSIDAGAFVFHNKTTGVYSPITYVFGNQIKVLITVADADEYAIYDGPGSRGLNDAWEGEVPAGLLGFGPWYEDNNWPDFIYYGMVDDYLQGSTQGDCGESAPDVCFEVSMNGPNGPVNDKVGAFVVASGIPIAGSLFEPDNADPDSQQKRAWHRSATFNDQLLVVYSAP